MISIRICYINGEDSSKWLAMGPFLGKGLKPEEAEIRRLRNELEDIKEELDI